METGPGKPQNMIDTTDALEAVSACQTMKNFLFVLILIGLILCQIVFWMDRFGLVRSTECSACSLQIQTDCPAIHPQSPCSDQAKPQANVINQQRTETLLFLAAIDTSTSQDEAAGTDAEAGKSIEETIDRIVETANQQQHDVEILLEKEADHIPAEIPTEHAAQEMLEPQPSQEETEMTPEDILEDKASLFRISCGFATVLVSICNYVVVIAAILYSLTLLICLKISLTGRLGGINHITRAFFISLFLLVILIPWQMVLPGVLIGALWRPGALWCECWTRTDGSLFWNVLLYLRFCGLFLLALWMLIVVQMRSAKWARATLRRLGVAK